MSPYVKIELSTYDRAPISKVMLSTKAESFRSIKRENDEPEEETQFDAVDIKFPPNSSFERVYRSFLWLQRLCGTDGAAKFAGQGARASTQSGPEDALRAERERKKEADAARERDEKRRADD